LKKETEKAFKDAISTLETCISHLAVSIRRARQSRWQQFNSY